jgi:hypothetical protein
MGSPEEAKVIKTFMFSFSKVENFLKESLYG